VRIKLLSAITLFFSLVGPLNCIADQGRDALVSSELKDAVWNYISYRRVLAPTENINQTIRTFFSDFSGKMVFEQNVTWSEFNKALGLVSNEHSLGIQSAPISEAEYKQIVQKERLKAAAEPCDRTRDALPVQPTTLTSINDTSAVTLVFARHEERIMERSEKNREWKFPQYRIPNFFEINKDIYHRPLARLSPVELQSKFQPRSKQWLDVFGHSIETPSDMPAGFSPIGRIGDGLKRDEMFHQHAQTIIQNRYQNAKNTLFINYTGHEGPVAAALAKRNIPTYWRLTASSRILDQMQDWREDVTQSNGKNDSNAGLILEPNHGGGGSVPITLSQLPDIATLKAKGITKIVVFTEDTYSEKAPHDYRKVESNWPDLEFRQFVAAAGQKFDIAVEGLDQP
jgi:hypothetical protein